MDSQYEICGAIGEALASTSQNEVEHAYLRGYSGRHLIDFFQDLFPDHSLEEILGGHPKAANGGHLKTGQ